MSERESSTSSSEAKEKKNKPKKTLKSRTMTVGPYADFKQQSCPSCILIMRPVTLGFCFLILGLICAALGIIWLVSASYAVETKTFRYDNLCEEQTKCTFRFEVEEDMDAPVYLYYRIEGYYQAYRRYYTSRNDQQLLGNNVNKYDKLGTCTPKISANDDTDDSNVYLPCGLVAASFFNDTFLLLTDDGHKVDQDDHDINLSGDHRLYSDPGPNTEGIRVVDSFENRHFWVWFNVAALPNFNKLYAVIEDDLPAGVYRMEIKNYYPTRKYNAKKFFHLSTTTWIGGRHFVIGSALCIVSVILLALSIFVLIKSCIYPRALGNIAYLDWK